MQCEKNFEIELLERRRRIKSNGQFEDFYVFKIEIGGNVIKKKVPENKVESFSWVVEATHGVARYRGKRGIENNFYNLVHDAIDDKISEVPFLTFYERNGWKRFPEGWFYVEGNGVIGSRRKDVFGNSEMCLQIDHQILEIECCKQFMLMEKVLVNPDISRFLMIFLCASVLGTLYEEIGAPLRFVLALLGTTNTMKTTTAKLFTQFYNARDIQKLDVTFASTKGGIETFVSQYTDAILLIDDFMPADNRAEMQEMVGKLKSIIRMYGDRVAKSRMSADPTRRREVNEVCGSCIVTAEILPGIKSSQTRVITLELVKNGVDKEWLTYFQKRPLLLPTFLHGFIEYVSLNCELILRHMTGFFEIYRNSAGFSVPRYNDVAAQMRVALDLFCNYLNTMGLNGNDVRLEWTRSVYTIIARNDNQQHQTDYAAMIAEAIVEGIAQRKGTKSVKEITKLGIGEIYEDDLFYYITAGDMFTIYRQYCGRYGIPCYLGKNDIIKKMLENDMLETVYDYRGYVQTSRKLCQGQGITQRFLYIRKNNVSHFCEKEDVL